MRALTLLGAFCALLLGASGTAHGATDALEVGWVERTPYAYEVATAHSDVITGLDIELLREAAVESGHHVELTRFEDETALEQALRAGSVDVGTGFASKANDALVGARLRTEQDGVWVGHGFGGATSVEALKSVHAAGGRICRVTGEVLANEALEGWLDDPAHARSIVRLPSEEHCIHDFAEGRTDAVVGDHLAIATAAFRADVGAELWSVGNDFETPVHLLWSPEARRSGKAQSVEDALAAMAESGATTRLIHQYLFPVVASITVDSAWFWWIDLLGTMAFIVSGLMIARREQYSIVGAAVLGTLPAVGGGVTRDLLAGRDPVGFLRDPIYAECIVAFLVAGYLLARLGLFGDDQDDDSFIMKSGNLVIDFFDTLGLASFTVTGVVVAVGQGQEPLWLWGGIVFAFFTSSGGGIIRDMVRRQKPGSLSTSFYPEVAIFWGILLSLWLTWQGAELEPESFGVAVIVTMAGAFFTRGYIWYRGIEAPQY